MNRFLVFVCFLVIIACDKNVTDNEIKANLPYILGSWQQISYQYSIGGPLLSEDIKDGVIIRFKENLTFTIKNLESDPPITGVFSIKNDILTRIYDKDADKVNYISKTMIAENVLTLIPIGPQICIEGCSIKYKKID